jgi:peptidyl-prolyl cis-trans isomerase A (cyclophilin A)
MCSKSRCRSSNGKTAAGFEKTESGLRYQFIQRGKVKKQRSGKTVAVHYEGSLENGKVFDSSYPKKTNEFRLEESSY